MIDLAIRLGVYASRVQFLEAIDESDLVTAAAEFDVGLVPIHLLDSIMPIVARTNFPSTWRRACPFWHRGRAM